MIELQLAGAGAGKTYGLAENIAAYISTCGKDRNVFALTYTNSATAKIQSEIIKILGHIPNNLIIQTVHSFLLHEIIYPYSNYSIGEIYSNISLQPIGDPIYKAAFFKRLKTKNIIHAENVYHISRLIVDKECSRHNTKTKKSKVDFLLNLINSTFEKIYVDEVQDLDEEALSVFNILGVSGVNIYMIGDTKQALKWTTALRDYIKNSESHSHMKLLPANNLTRRMPEKILKVSNLFCFEGQEQSSLSKTEGMLTYIESSDSGYVDYLKDDSTDRLIYIDKKQGRYLTKSGSNKIGFPSDIRDKISLLKHRKNQAIFEESLYLDLLDDVFIKGVKVAINSFLRKHRMDLTPQEYAQLASCITPAQENKDTLISVSSIDAVKGLDSEHCIFILSKNTANYLCKMIPESSHFNKEWMRMYVALTRAKRELTLAIDHDFFKIKELVSLKKNIENLGFVKLNL